MAHFYGTMQGNRGKSTRCATKNSGLTVTAASWDGAVSVSLSYNESTGKNEFTVALIPWRGAGESRELAKGAL
jgi:hypothetical protein